MNDDDIEDVVGGTLVGALYGGGIKDLFDNNGIFKKGADGAADMAEHPNSSPLVKKALYECVISLIYGHGLCDVNLIKNK